MKRSPATIPVAERLSALAEPIRLRIARLLEAAELTVGEVGKVVQHPQSTVSRHLKILSDAGLLQKRSEGTAAYYRLVLDDLDPEARQLWRAVEGALAADVAVQDDLRRVRAVLAERTTDSLSFFGRVAGQWDEVRRQLFGNEFTARGLLGLLPPDWTVADLGCGTGNAAELIAPFVKQVIAVDQSRPMLKAAKKRLAALKNVRFIDGPLEAIPLEDGCVDAATLIMVLHHIADPGATLGEVRRILRPGGTVLIVDMFEHERAEYRSAMGHRHLGFAQERMLAMLEEAGFRGARLAPLQLESESKGPGLFVATGLNQGNRPDLRSSKQ